MRKIDKIKKKWTDFKFDHIHLMNGLSIAKSSLFAIVAAALYAFSFYCFITPAVVDHTTIIGSSVITGGVGGLSQVFTIILDVCGAKTDPYLIQSICYFAFNIPILIFAFFKVGKKFALITLLNVLLSSLFIQLFNHIDLMKEIAKNLEGEHLTRVLFGGLCVGLSSALAYRGEVSCGGMDVFSYYFSLRKSTSVGKYSVMLNGAIIVVYTIMTIIYNGGQRLDIAILNFMYSLLYLFITSLVIDFINKRNKKVQLQIITTNEAMSSILIANFPHSTTIVNAEGGYSHKPRKIIYMTISSNEVKMVMNIIRKIDSHAFVSVTALIQAYGNFFIKPVE